jgi:hypothetical protein
MFDELRRDQRAQAIMTNAQPGQAANASSKRKLGQALPPHFKHDVRIDALAQEGARGAQQRRLDGAE